MVYKNCHVSSKNSSKLLLEKEVCYFILFKKDEKTQKNRESNEFFFNQWIVSHWFAIKKKKKLILYSENASSVSAIQPYFRRLRYFCFQIFPSQPRFPWALFSHSIHSRPTLSRFCSFDQLVPFALFLLYILLCWSYWVTEVMFN